MFFSGHAQMRGCADCDFLLARTTPTSILYYLALAGCGTAIIIPALARSFGPRWWYWLAVPVAELVGVFLAMTALLWLRDRIFRFPERCPRCSGEMVSKGSGFHDGCLPSAAELLLLVLFVVAHVAVGIALGTPTAP